MHINSKSQWWFYYSNGNTVHFKSVEVLHLIWKSSFCDNVGLPWRTPLSLWLLPLWQWNLFLWLPESWLCFGPWKSLMVSHFVFGGSWRWHLRVYSYPSTHSFTCSFNKYLLSASYVSKFVTLLVNKTVFTFKEFMFKLKKMVSNLQILGNRNLSTIYYEIGQERLN